MYPRFAPEPADHNDMADLECLINHIDDEVFLDLGRHLSDQEAAVIAHLVGEDLIEVNGYYDAYAIVTIICAHLGVDIDKLDQTTEESASETLEYICNKYANKKMQ